jgi:beta-galactosidase/beta-glucuronidase
MELNKNWKFSLIDLPEAWRKDYDDSAWENVTVPHDWAVSQPFSEEYSSGTGYLPGGTGWYRRRFKINEENRGKKLWLCFDGVYKNCQVWLNGYNLGKHAYGYTPFRFDISDSAAFGETENVISVRVNHTDISDSRWYTGSGITRGVSLLVKERLYFENLFFSTPEVTPEYALVKITAEAVNETGETSQGLFKAKIGGLELETAVNLQPNERKMVELSGSLDKPRLWSVDSPFLYTLESYKTVKAGVRAIEFTADGGFFLNGVNMKLKGVCLHHDAGCLGAAAPKNVWKRRLLKLKEMGANAVRCSHNPQDPALYELCDELGLLVIDEAFDEWENTKNKWSRGHNVYPPKYQGYAEDFHEWGERDLRAMIRRDRNHPSVILWSIGNEIDYPNDPYAHPSFIEMTGNNDSGKPEESLAYNPDRPNMERICVIARKLSAVVKSEDPTRPVTAAAAFPELSAKLGFFESLDVVGYNYKEHLYEQDHASFPDKPIFGSETKHSPEAWQAVVDKDFIAGQFLWTGVDFLGETQGWPKHGSSAGLLDLAGFEKPEFYVRRQMWTGKPIPADTPHGEGAALKLAPVEQGGSEGNIVQIEVYIVDAKGGTVENNSSLITVSVMGGTLAGIENGDLYDNTPYSSNSRRVRNGKAVIYVRLGAGTVFVSVKSGLPHISDASLSYTKARKEMHFSRRLLVAHTRKH